MNRFHVFGAVLIVSSIVTLPAPGQIPSMPSVPGGIPSAPAVPGVPGAPAVPGVPATPTSNIWSQLFPSSDQLAKCKASFCAHPIGQMINSMMAPLTLYSGGLITPCCPPNDQPNPADLAAGADTTEGAVAAIKADEAGAKKRRAEMRYLGTVDCHYWPEAEAALIKGLRTDKNECVRWEAANSLGRGCCCTRKTIEALVIAATASERDGNPAELSDWVKGRALKAINHCLCCYREKPSTQPKEKPVKATSMLPGAGPGSAPTSVASSASNSGSNALPSSPANLLLPRYYTTLDRDSADRILAEANEAVAKLDKPSPNVPIPAGRHTVSDIMAVAATGELPHNSIAQKSVATDVTANTPIKPVPAGTPTPPPAPVAPPPDTDLLHYFKSTKSALPSAEPPRSAAQPSVIQPAVGQQNVTPQTLSPSVPVSAPLPPTGSRDLFHVLQNSIGGN
jgi:hypothetical protein